MRKSGLASLAFFYCDFREDEKKDRRGLLSSLLVQLCHQSDSYCDILSGFYLEHAKGSQYPSDDALVQCLKDILKTSRTSPRLPDCGCFGRMSKYIRDAVSPREGPNARGGAYRVTTSNLRVCVTSRPETDIKAVLDDLSFPFGFPTR
jgi:hypothetical protein